jgi:hypothetical protein
MPATGTQHTLDDSLPEPRGGGYRQQSTHVFRALSTPGPALDKRQCCATGWGRARRGRLVGLELLLSCGSVGRPGPLIRKNHAAGMSTFMHAELTRVELRR